MANQQDRPDKDQSRQGSERTDRGFGSNQQTSNPGADKSPTSRNEEIGQDKRETGTEDMSREGSSRRDSRQDSKKPF